MLCYVTAGSGNPNLPRQSQNAETSWQDFSALPPDLQAAIIKAGREAGAFGRHLESTEDAAILAKLEKEGKLLAHELTQRDELLKLAEPAKAAYAKEIKAEKILARINALE